MAINPVMLLQLKASWDRFNQDHPKFLKFWRAAYKNGLEEGTIVEFKITAPDGKEMGSNLKLKSEDVELMRQVLEMYSM